MWAARHLSLGEEVAIKLVMRDGTHDDGSKTDSRFLLEARVAAQLSRKTRHIVSVTDHGEDGPYAYLVMELLEGESLDARLARTGPLSVRKAVPILYQIARALAVAHSDGIVHRDLKPSNVFVTVDEDGRALIKILDFGIAKMRSCSARRLPVEEDVLAGRIGGEIAKAARTHATMGGFLLGTPDYMSPEQARADAIDHRADVWALGVIAYHLLTQRFPFDGETIEELFLRIHIVEQIPIHTYRPDLPPKVGELFEQAFAPRIEERFQSAVAFARAFEKTGELGERSERATPAPMVKISLPPPLVVVRSEEHEPEASATNDMIDELYEAYGSGSRLDASREPRERRASRKDDGLHAAGLPSKRPWVRAAVALGLLAFLGAVGSAVWFGLDPAPRTERAEVGSVASPSTSSQEGAPVEAREAIPLPEPAPVIAKTAASPPTILPSAPPTAPVAPKRAEPSAEPPRPQAPAPDRSEVF